jgi:tRNA 2-thiouridine synthesizing protein A
VVKFEKIEESRYVLDVRGYVCPYPVIYTRKAIARLKRGEVLEVITDNPPSCENVPRAASEDGHEVMSIERVEVGVWKIVIRKR